MDVLRTECPSCENTLRLKNPDLAGKRIRCPKCEEPFRVPEFEPDDDWENDSEEEARPRQHPPPEKIVLQNEDGDRRIPR